MEGYLTLMSVSGIAWAMAGLGLVLGAAATWAINRFTFGGVIKRAREEAEGILARARDEAETTRKQIELDARAAATDRRETFEKEMEATRAELRDQEKRLTNREDNLDRKLDTLEKKEKYLEERENKLEQQQAQVKAREAELEELVEKQRALLEASEREQKQITLRLSGLGEEEARRQCLRRMEDDVKHEASQLIQRETALAEEQARERARKITLQAIQRYAAEHTAESTARTVDLPSDDMKGRVIGREGRNIRAFEAATGVDVIVDDTPGVVVVSCFDPVRRAIAAESMTTLIDDGRIHPTRIEEVVGQVREEMAERVIQYGKDAAIEADVHGLHAKIIEAMGKLHYRTSYGQNILQHALEVAYLAQVIADELGLDGTLARRCGFLHDIGKAMDHDTEGGHPQIGMEFARRHGEKEAVLNAIGGHHNDIPATTPYTPIVMAADTISGSRPGARRETLERYVKRLEQLESIAMGKRGVKSAFAIQAGREVRVVVDPEGIDDEACRVLARQLAREVSEEMTFPGEIQITVLREMRTVEYAK